MFNGAAELQRELTPGERLLWSGQPRQGLRLESKDWFLIPFGILWFGLALFWEIQMFEAAVRAEDSRALLVLFFGLPFVLAGFHLLAGRFLLDARKRARTAYGVTDRRILAVRGGRKRRLSVVDLERAGEVVLDEQPDRSGTIRIIERSVSESYVKAGREQRYPSARGLRLEAIPRVRDAFEAIQQARQRFARRKQFEQS